MVVTTKKIALVGHCGVDGPRLQQELESIFRNQVQVARVNDEPSVQRAVKQGATVLLFNREMVGDFDDPSGIDLLRRLHEQFPDRKMMLVSDHEEAQEEAEEAGAIPGFGKSELGTPEFEERIRAALA
jgi:hypothetical protein